MREFGVWLIEHKSELLACLIEIIMILIGMHGIFKDKFKFLFMNISVIFINMTILCMINYGIVNKSVVIVIYVVYFIYCICKFKSCLA